MEYSTPDIDQIEQHEDLRFGEECGVVAVVGDEAAVRVRRGLGALQHRGQESAGIGAFDEATGLLIPHADMGLVPQVLTDEVIDRMSGARSMIGHVRYGTSDKSVVANAQPITMEHEGYAISNATNGNLINSEWLRQNTTLRSEATSDTGLQTAFLLERRARHKSWIETLQKELPYLQGAFSNVMLTEEGETIGFRGEHGIRPLCLGRFGENGWGLSSETVGLDLMGMEFVREIAPGEIIRLGSDGSVNSFFYGEPRREQPCVFEQVYFARPDSYTRGKRIRAVREESGRMVARRLQQKGIVVDAVVPVFDSGFPAAKGAAQELEVPTVEAITTSHYTGRTFIQPGQNERVAKINGKHNFTPDEVIDKEVVFVDDSTVRSNTGRRIAAGLRDAGARRIHHGNASPPIVDTCDLGVDLPTTADLPAAAWRDQGHDSIEHNMAELMGSDTVTFLTVDDLAEAVGETTENFCHHCLGGKHPILDEQEQFPIKERPLDGPPKISIFASGSGTNAEEIMRRVAEGDLEAQVHDIISNKPDAYVLQRANAFDVPSHVFSSKGILRDPERRYEYNRALADHIEQNLPDALVLAGWMVVFDDEFLRRMQELEIPVINIHPALLSPKAEATVSTSRGAMPVIRGAHAIEDAYQQNVPVSGVTIHQILPDMPFDTGPILYKEEVRRRSSETLEQWTARIHQAEYRALPTALKRAAHVMKHNIDISKGTYPW
ncbi:MAG: hypothetical protein RI947_1418 [Candidatus Parcubacteria bacterium]|jgi:amidophosphoribosyltransferase